MKHVKSLCIKCPFCGEEFSRDYLRENLVREDFVFEEVKSWNESGYLCCNLCEAPVTELEDLDEDLE